MRRYFSASIGMLFLVPAFAATANAQAQAPAPTGAARWSIDAGVGIDPSINGNVNSGAIGTSQGQATAILPQSYAAVYGTGIQLRFGAGWAWKPDTELRGVITFQSADANLVRLGDLGASSLYGQYSDYQSVALDLGVRRYVPVDVKKLRVFGEATIGFGFIDAIDVKFAAPQSNVVFNDTDFYDQTAAFTFGINAGVLFQMTDRVDFTAQMGLRHVSGLSEVDQLVGTGLETINNDSGRLTFPIVVGLRFRFK